MASSWIPDEIKQQILEKIINFVAGVSDKFLNDSATEKIKGLSSRFALEKSLQKSLQKAIDRFENEYIDIDEDLTVDILKTPDFWDDENVQKSIIQLVSNPGSWQPETKDIILNHFDTILQQRRDRNRVNRAVTYLLRCVAEEAWTIPAAKQIRELYLLHTEHYNADLMQKQIVLQEAQLQAQLQSFEINADLYKLILELISTHQRHLLESSSKSSILALPRPRPYHNLPYPDYIHFIGRESELSWLRRRLSSQDRAWQVLLTGIGGVGKTAIAQAIAYEFCNRYQEISPEERFEAIIWISAKSFVLTPEGKKPAGLQNVIFRNLEDIYTAIAQTLDREDITRASQNDQDNLVRKILSEQRILLIIDNEEDITDDRVELFLRNLPLPSKAIVTSRGWTLANDFLKITGLPFDDADKLIIEESKYHGINLTVEQRKQIIEYTAGLPLPIKLSIPRIASGDSFDLVLRWLGDAVGDLPEYCVKGQIDLLRERYPNAWKLLLACSLFEQDRNTGSSREALGYVSDLSLVDRDSAIAQLLRLSLINEVESDRFWILPIVERYIITQFFSMSFSQELLTRWLSWLTELINKYGIDLMLHIEQVSILRKEYPNLKKAINWCYKQGLLRELIYLTEGTWFYSDLIGRLTDFEELISAQTYAANILNDSYQKALILHEMAVLSWERGDYNSAEKHLLASNGLPDIKRNVIIYAWNYHIYSSILLQSDNLAKAEEVIKATMALGESCNNIFIKSLAAYRYSQLQSARGDFEDALNWAILCENTAKEINNFYMLAWSSYRVGCVLFQQKKDKEVIEMLLKKSYDMANQCDERGLSGHCLYQLAKLYAFIGRLDLAAQYGEEARSTFERIGRARRVKDTESFLKGLEDNNDFLRDLLNS